MHIFVVNSCWLVLFTCNIFQLRSRLLVKSILQLLWFITFLAFPCIECKTASLKPLLFRYALYDAKRKTLDSVQRLFGIPPKPFSELDKTGEELKLLGLLYGLFQKFIAFDRKFRDTLWEGAKLHDANAEVFFNQSLSQLQR